MVSRPIANGCSKDSNKITRPQLLTPVYAQNFIASPLTSRPLKGTTPTVDLVFGYKKLNKSPILKLLLSRLDELIARVSKKAK
jgi:LysR family hca operon transcriptional activator